MIFIVCFYFVPIPVYNGILMLGYSTIFTMFPVFSLVFDEDIDEKTSMDYVNFFAQKVYYKIIIFYVFHVSYFSLHSIRAFKKAQK